MSLPSLDDNSLDDLYKWLSMVPLYKKSNNIAKDFSDGVLVAELVAHFLPRYVNLSNFTAVSSKALKRYNWETLNKLVFVHLNFSVNQSLVQKIIICQPGAIEFVLSRLREKIEQALQARRFKPTRRRSQSVTHRDGSNLSLHGVDDGDTMKTSVHNDLPRQCQQTVDQDYSRMCNDLTIPLVKYHQCKRDLLVKDEYIQKLHARIRHLERLNQLKDEHISELSLQLDKLARFKYTEQNVELRLANENEQKELGTPQSSSDQSFITSNSMSPKELSVRTANSFIDLK